MGRLHNVLIERYASHHTALLRCADLPKPERHVLRAKERTFGSLVAGLPTGSRILDAGCGTGTLIHWLLEKPGIVPVGVDSSASQVEIAQHTLPQVEVHCEDGLTFLRNHPASYAGIFCTDVLEHLPEDDQCLDWAEATYAALQPGGFFVCGGPNAANLACTYIVYGDFTHFRAFTETSLIQLMEAAGFMELRFLPFRSGLLVGRLGAVVKSLVHRFMFLSCHVSAPKSGFSHALYVAGVFKPRGSQA